MRNLTTLIILFFALVFVGLDSALAQAPKFAALDKSPLDMAYYPRRGEKIVKVVYSRPAKSGRAIFGELEKFGQVWRAGANEATEISFSKDVTMGGKAVKAGTYLLFVIPNQDKWTVILNSEKDQWGAYSYKKESNVVEVDVPVKTSADVIENFSISVDEAPKGATLYMGWDKTYVEVPLEFSK